MNVIWTTTNGGSITNKGAFKGDYKKREVTVTAKLGKFSDTAKVILLPVLRRLEVQPGFVYLRSSEQQTFAVKGLDQFGFSIAPGEVDWETTGGEIAQDGTLTFTQNEQGYFQVTATSQVAPKYTQDIRKLFLYTGISSRIISYLISYEMLLQEMFALDSGSIDTEENSDDSIVDETQELDISTEEFEAIQEMDTIVIADEQLDIEVDQTTDIDTIVDPNVLDFHTALEEWFWKKLQKLVARIFLSISRFCLSEASANLGASADVFVLAVEDNPYKYFECLNIINGYSESVTGLAITPDGQRLISSSWWDEPIIKIWNLNTGDLLSNLEDNTHYVKCVPITQDGQTLVSAGWDSTIGAVIDNGITGDWNSLIDSSINIVKCVPITPGGQTLVSAGWDSTIGAVIDNGISGDWNSLIDSSINIWDLETNEARHSLYCSNTLDLNTGKLRTIIGWNMGWVSALAITPDGKTLITSNYETIKIWDLTAKKYPDVRLTLKNSAETVKDFTLTPDGQRIVSASYKINDDYDYESFIEIWDLNTGELLHSIKEYSTNDSCVYCLAITPDGKQIISGHGDGTIRIWGIPEFSL